MRARARNTKQFTKITIWESRFFSQSGWPSSISRSDDWWWCQTMNIFCIYIVELFNAIHIYLNALIYLNHACDKINTDPIRKCIFKTILFSWIYFCSVFNLSVNPILTPYLFVNNTMNLSNYCIDSYVASKKKILGNTRHFFCIHSFSLLYYLLVEAKGC